MVSTLAFHSKGRGFESVSWTLPEVQGSVKGWTSAPWWSDSQMGPEDKRVTQDEDRQGVWVGWVCVRGAMICDDAE